MEEKETLQQQVSEDDLMAAISQMSYSEYTRLQDFITLSQQLKAKQEAIDVMAADSTPSAIGASYVADVLEPNSQGDLVTLVAKDPGNQIIIDNIYRRLNLPLDKIVYSLFKNAIAIGEFAHDGDLVNKVEEIKDKQKSANEGIEKSATEDILVKVHNSKLVPKINLISDTTRIFPILQYETVVGFIEITLEDYAQFNFANDTISYKDIVIHSAEDYAYVKFGYRTETNPLILKVKLEDGTVVEYTIDQGRSLLESAYPAWQTLSIMKDAVNLARLAYSASSIVVQTEVGNMTEPQIELARNKLKDLFENRLALGKNGMKSYLQPQIKPNYIYAFTNNGKGAITTNTIGGDYNPGVLTDLNYFEDEFFGAMGAVKQHFARTGDGAGLDGGGAVEQYEKRYRSYVSQFKRLLADFIKNCINKVLGSRGLYGLCNEFDVIVNQAYREDDMQMVNLQTSKLSFLQQAIEFMEIDDPRKVKELKLQALKTVVVDKSLMEAFTSALLGESKTKGNDETGDGDLGGDEDLTPPSTSGGGLMDEISSIGPQIEDEDFGEPTDEDLGEGGEELPNEEGETIEMDVDADELDLPPVDEIVPESQIDEE